MPPETFWVPPLATEALVGRTATVDVLGAAGDKARIGDAVDLLNTAGS